MKNLAMFFMCFFVLNTLAVNFDDFIENEIIQPQNFFSFQEKGFGVFDTGDNQIKVFNWKFEKLFAIPLKKGQGPGQLKNQYVATVLLIKENVLVIPQFDKKLLLFSKKGKFLKDIKTDFSPSGGFYVNDKIYIFDGSISFENEKTVIAHEFDLKTMKMVKNIEVEGMKREKNELSKQLGNVVVTGISAKLTMSEKNCFIIIDTQNGRMFEVNDNGKIMSNLNLPDKQKFKMKKTQKGNSVSITMVAEKYFSSVESVFNKCYISFIKNPEDEEKANTLILNSDYKTASVLSNLKGNWKIIGVNNHKLYIFNKIDYEIKTITI